ncbi:MAG: sodium/proline symporter [Gammaproteobacteria bacterium]|nr:sodium/proline symporter [Gammaproteobacteria bacterium]
MSDQFWIMLTLVGYMITLVLIGVWAQRRTQDQEDYFLGGRQLGPWVAGLSASASSSSAWALLGVSGTAYAVGMEAFWFLPGVLGGYIFSWFWVAPRLRKAAELDDAVTLSELLFGRYELNGSNPVIRSASIIILVSFMFYVAAQFQGAGLAFSSSFGLTPTVAILVGALIVLIYTLIGGFWAVAVTDAIQAALMVSVAALLPVLCLFELGGFTGLLDGISAVDDEVFKSFTGKYSGLAAVGFVLGMLSPGAAYHGQPHVVNRFMALKDDVSLRQGRIIAVSWAFIVFSGMLILGWSARVLFPMPGNEETIFFYVTQQLLPPVIAGIMTAGVLSAIMSTADSQLLVAASSIARDWNLKGSRAHAKVLTDSRVVVTIVTVIACGISLYLPSSIFDRVLFAWQALGASFGPLVILFVCKVRVSRTPALVSLWLGFGLTVLLNWAPSTPGDVAERVLPSVIALLVAWFGREHESDLV